MTELLLALAIITKVPTFAWIALALIVLGFIASIGGQHRTGYFNPFSGGSIHVEPLWYHCTEHGNVPIRYAGAPLKCHICGGPIEKGKIKN